MRIFIQAALLYCCFSVIGCAGQTAAMFPSTPPHASRVSDAPPDAANESLVRWVDPFIGTAGEGYTFPGAVAPWGMVSVSPHNLQTSQLSYLSGGPFSASGYLHGQPKLSGLGLTHLSGVGCPDLGAPVIAASTGPLTAGLEHYASSYGAEVAEPGYYAVTLKDMDVRVEATASTRAAILRMSFPKDRSTAHILVDPVENLSWKRGQGLVDILSNHEVQGWSQTGAFCSQGNDQRVFFYARLSTPAQEQGTWTEQALSPQQRAEGRVGAWFRINPASTPVVELRVGVSFVSMANARDNLEQELGGHATFDSLRHATQQVWEHMLGRVRISGGSDDQRTIFYTALYHSLLHPNVLSDVNGQYPIPGQDEPGEAIGYTRYTVFSMWDTYRTVHPLLTLLYPKQQLDMMRSLVALTREHDAVPKWELINREVNMMVGDPGLIVLADAWLKGLRDVDVASIYPIMRRGALEDTDHRPGGVFYRTLGYVPIELASEVWGPVSTTLEYAVADHALAQLARALGHVDDANALEAQSRGYRALFDTTTGLFRPRFEDGRWHDPFDQDAIKGCGMFARLGGPGFVEGTAWHYAFLAPHDIDGLIEAHGDASTLVAHLQTLFDTRRFVMWNEPDMAFPYLFTHIPGQAWRTDQAVRQAITTFFTTAPDGLPGNDDTGTLSAWYVFSSMGLYPDQYATGRYSLTAPLFERVELTLDPDVYPGTSVVIATDTHNHAGPWVASRHWNGTPVSGASITHERLTQGGVLDITLADAPPSTPMPIAKRTYAVGPIKAPSPLVTSSPQREAK